MIGSAIKAYLEENGIKQSFVAEKSGIDPSRMSAILNNGRSIDCVTYYKICKALNVPLGQFFEGLEL